LLKTASDPITGVTLTGSYDAAGQLQSLTTGTAGSTRSFTYDDLGRLTSDSLGDPANPSTATHTISYGYDANSNRTATVVGPSTLTNGAAYNFGYTYDRVNRLTGWTNNATNATVTYGWDGAGNRVSVGSATATFDQRNRILSDTSGATYAWTAGGTLSSVTPANGYGGTAYGFDGFDRLITSNSYPYTLSYAYDGLNRTAQLTTQSCPWTCNPPTTSNFIYAGDRAELVSDGTYTYSHLPSGSVLGMTNGTTARLAGVDAHGDLTYTFSSGGAIIDASSSDPFGTPQAAFTSGGPTIGYQGQWSSQGNVDMGARWYGLGTGTFLSGDPASVPIQTATDANRYLYAGANPVTHADPSGLYWQVTMTKKQVCIMLIICHDEWQTDKQWIPDWDGQPPMCAYYWVSFYCAAPTAPPAPTSEPPSNPPSSPSGSGGSSGSASGVTGRPPNPGPQDSNRSAVDPNWPSHITPYPSGHAPVATGLPQPTPGPGPAPSASVNETISQSQNPAGGGAPTCASCTQLHGPPGGKPQGGGINWGQQAGEFGKGIGEGLLDLGKGAIGLGKLGSQCVFRGITGVDAFGCDKTLKAMGSYIIHHPTDVLGQMIDWDDWSHGRYARAAGHVLPSIVLTIGTAGVAGVAAKGGEAAGVVADAAEETTALVRWDPEFAARQLLEGPNVTPAGRSITFHAANRIVNGGRGIAPLGRENLGELDRVLDTSSELNYDPLRGTIRVGSARGPYVVVDSDTGSRIVTYLGMN
jgi:RHS repeat-associated protein